MNINNDYNRNNPKSILAITQELLARFLESDDAVIYNDENICRDLRSVRSFTHHVLNNYYCPYRTVEAIWIILFNQKIIYIYDNYLDAKIMYSKISSKIYFKNHNPVKDRIKMIRLL